MAKQAGMGDVLLYNGYDISGDVQSLGRIGGGPALLDVTSIDKTSHERITGLFGGEIAAVVFFNDATGQEHPVLKTLPATDEIIVYLRGTTLGNPGAGLVASRANYDPTRAADGMLTAAIQALNNAKPLEWGRQLTAGKRTDTGATAGTGVADNDSPSATAINISGTTAASPTEVTAASAHGLVTGDSVTISGTDKAALNGSFTVTVTSSTKFTVPVDLSGGAATGGSFLKTSTNYGWAAYLVVTAFSGTDATVTLRDSADDSSYANLTGGAFTAITTAPTVERIASASATAIVRKYLRATTSTSGGFSSMTFAVVFVRNQTTRLS